VEFGLGRWCDIQSSYFVLIIIIFKIFVMITVVAEGVFYVK
jgi:hypothetical protein